MVRDKWVLCKCNTLNSNLVMVLSLPDKNATTNGNVVFPQDLIQEICTNLGLTDNVWPNHSICSSVYPKQQKHSTKKKKKWNTPLINKLCYKIDTKCSMHHFNTATYVEKKHVHIVWTRIQSRILSSLTLTLIPEDVGFLQNWSCKTIQIH